MRFPERDDGTGMAETTLCRYFALNVWVPFPIEYAMRLSLSIFLGLATRVLTGPAPPEIVSSAMCECVC
jgi:hypothetical protein